MPSSRTPPTSTDTLASSREATRVTMLATTDGDMISTTNGRLVEAGCTTANALVVPDKNGGAPPKLPSLSPPRGERP